MYALFQYLSFGIILMIQSTFYYVALSSKMSDIYSSQVAAIENFLYTIKIDYLLSLNG